LAYRKYLAEKIALGIDKANSRLVPAKIGWGVGKDDTQVFNRRWKVKPGSPLRDSERRVTTSDRLPPETIVDVLNRYFECQVPAVIEHGGEVLKFMGDGLLAIFPIALDDSDATQVCGRVLEAARAARTNVAALDASDGHINCEVRIGCPIGRGGTVATTAGTPSYCVTAYAGADYQQFVGRTVVPTLFDSSVGYQPPDAAPNAAPNAPSGNGNASALPGTKRIAPARPSSAASASASFRQNGLASSAVIGLAPPRRCASRRSSDPAPHPTSRIASAGSGAIVSTRVRNIAR
jgi:hypothetical protein